MKLRRSHAGPLLAALAIFGLFALGCIAPPPAAPPSDPWGTTPAAPSPADCPDGLCPNPTGSAELAEPFGVEVTSDAPYAIDPVALIETKAADPFCVPCNPPTAKPTPARPSPPPSPPMTNTTKAEEPKTGAFACERCKRPTVGAQWQEIWTDDGVSLLCLCRACFTRATPDERETILRAYAARSSIDLRARPAVEQAIREAALGHP